jgi:dTMP kinase
MKGKFIVIEGTDGTGKETQTNLVVKELRVKGLKVKVMDFPQYEKTFFGKLVGRFLKGEFGNLKEVNPYLAALTFAGDRWQAKDEINSYLKKNYFVVSNRYVLSNMAHQSSKLPKEKRLQLIKFLEELEYKIYGIPKEDINILLTLPVDIGQKLIEKKKPRSYLGNKKKKDIQEDNLDYQMETSKMFEVLAKQYKNIEKINCCKDNKLMSIEEIHDIIWKKLRYRLNLE